MTSVSTLVAQAERIFDVPSAAIVGRSRAARYFHPRAAVALAARVGGMSYPAIGRALQRDHKTIMHACDVAESLYRAAPDYRRACDELIALAGRR